MIIACLCLKKEEKENGGDGDVVYEDPEKRNDTILLLLDITVLW